jgi:hypothetical protein
MTPTQESWQPVVDHTLEPLRTHFAPVLQSVADQPTDENIAGVTKSIAELGEYLVKREMMFGSQIPTNLRQQVPNEKRKDRAKATSEWTFPLNDNGTPSLSPTLTAAAIPITGLNCLRSNGQPPFDATLVFR